MRSHTKIKIARTLVSSLIRDQRNYVALKYQLEKIGISHPTYMSIIRTGECRSDVMDKIVNHLNK